MKWKDNLSAGERYAWATLIASGVVFFTFWGRMWDGLQMRDLGAGDLLGLYLRIIITFVVLHIVIAVVFAAKRGKPAEDGEIIERDERDMDIERRGNRAGFWTLAIIVEVVIFMLLFENAYPGDYVPPISVVSASGMFFALMGAVLLADIIKRVTMITAYRS